MMRSSSRIPGALIVWIASYVLFIITLVNNFSASHDSIHYLNDIVKGQNLFHQHHLLYNFLANKWMNFWMGYFKCGVTIEDGRIFCRPHYLIESFTALWGSSVLTMVYLFFRNRFHLTRTSCMLGTAVIGFSYGVWFYSVNIEVYMPPLFFILWCMYIMTGKELSSSDVWKITALHSLAILFHQVNVLFAIVVLYVLLRNQVTRSIIKYSLGGLVLTGGTYFIIGWFVVGNNSVDSLAEWLQGYTVGHSYWQPLSARTPLHVLTGFTHAFVGGHFMFRIPVIERYMQQSFQSHGLKDELFLTANMSNNTAWFLAVLALIVAAILIILIIKFLARYRAMRMHSRVINPLLLSLLVYSLFFCFWMPEILEFWILQMVIVWLLLVGMLPVLRFPFGLRQEAGLFVLAAFMCCINFLGSLRWMQDSKNDFFLVETKKIAASVTAKDMVIVENEWILKDYLRYYTSATIVATDEPGYNKRVADQAAKEVLAKEGRVFTYRDGQLIQAY